ncbi:MAG: lysophospholipase [Thermoanaerobaculia bacterium]|nr:lysophospholipase [Thermoanaerobaculia bacterium]
MKRVFATLALLLIASSASGAEEAAQLKATGGTIHGTLLVPAAKQPMPVALIIAGSGPTDRNGNNKLLSGPNDSLKMLAEALASSGIASMRYDKRAIGESAAAGAVEADLRFDTYVDDASGWIELLEDDPRFSGVVVIGHSEGSLIGMLAARAAGANGFISIAGTARPAADLIRAQLAGKLPAELAEANERALTELVAGRTVADPPAALAALYRPSVQPYLISWFRHDPAAEIAKLEIPVLIVQGTTDIQVPVDEAHALAKAKGDAKLAIIEGMNHVLKLVGKDQAEQVASYSRNDLPIAPKLVEVVVELVRSVVANPPKAAKSPVAESTHP